MTVNELKHAYIEETMSALGNEVLMEAILDAVRKVKVKFPHLGKIEPSLKGLGREYRSLVVHKNYKVIYI